MTNPNPDKHGDFTTSEKEILNQWFTSQAQGEENVTGIDIPPLNRRRRFGRRMIIWQIAAALAVFFIGYVSGRAHETTALNSPSPIASTTPAQQPITKGVMSSGASTPQSADGSSVKTKTLPVTKSNPPTKDCAAPQIRRDQNGRFSIDTVLCQSGSHATWVINPRLEIANVSHHSNQENEK